MAISLRSHHAAAKHIGDGHLQTFLSGAGGFDALVGNPPFVGGKKLTGLFGDDFRDHLVLYLADGRRGSADLCAYFFLRAVQVLRPRGTFGLLAVNTIAEGDTRQVGLEAMLRQGIALYAARPNFEWPGAAAVVASAVHGVRGDWQGLRRINGAVVPTISAYLSAEDEWSPKPLQKNASTSFIGSYVLGMGFTLPPPKARQLIQQDLRNSEVLMPYIGGEDLNSSPDQHAPRYVISFWDWPLERSVGEASWSIADERQRDAWFREGRVPLDYPGLVAADFPELLEIVRRLVKPERDRKNRPVYRDRWWHYAEKQQALYHAIGRGQPFARHPVDWSNGEPLEHVIAFAQTSKTKYPLFIPNRYIFSHKVVVIASQDLGLFAILSSSIHYAWAHVQGSRMKTDAVYTPTDVYETFPFPGSEFSEELRTLGRRLHEYRSELMRSQNLGLTQLYSRFHSQDIVDPEVVELRRVHCEIDRLVLSSYGWHDVRCDHGFHWAEYVVDKDKTRYTISEPTRLDVMRRLSALNRRRFQEEQDAAQSLQAAQAELTAPRKRAGRPTARKTATPSGQTPLFE